MTDKYVRAILRLLEGDINQVVTPNANGNLLERLAYIVQQQSTADTGEAVSIADLQSHVDAIQAALAGITGLTGNAVVANVLATKTFYKDDYTTKLTGTMPNNAGDVASVSAHMGAGQILHVVPATGYTDGVDDATTVVLNVVDADLDPVNIKNGVTILGTPGTYDLEAGSPIAAGTVLNGKVGFVNGAKVTGTMVDQAGATAATSSAIDGTTLKLLASEGYRDGVNDYVTITDAAFIATNIKDGVTLFGLLGTYVP